MVFSFRYMNFVSALVKPFHHSLNQSYTARCYSGEFSPIPHNRSPALGLRAQSIHLKAYGGRLHYEAHDRFPQIFCKNDGEKAGMPENSCGDDVSRTTLIWRAIKLPIYCVALVPLTVGGAAAYLQTGVVSTRSYFCLLASSVLIITWLNLSNDVYDFDTGADKNKKESVVNLVGSRTGTLVAACSSLVLGVVGLVWTSINAGNTRSILLLVSAILCGYIYQCPPFRLSYQGLGEPLCFAAFGPFATTAFYLLLGSTSQATHLALSSTILLASVLIGFTTTLILFCSHFHQVDEDRAIGKMSPMVRIGTKRGSSAVKSAIITLYTLLLATGLTGALPFACVVLCGLTVPMGKLVINFIEENHEDKQKIFMAKYYCVRLHTLFGAALSLGLIAARKKLTLGILLDVNLFRP